MIILAVILKIIFHHLTWLARILPESCVLIVIGILVGTFVHYVILDDILGVETREEMDFPVFTATLFFNVLLPPIILDSALALYDTAFFDNFVSIVIFAVFGTLFNTFTIGYSLYGLSSSGLLGTFDVLNPVTNTTEMMQLKPTECLIFSSLISAVDPVAVLAIFEELNVNVGLYFLVFGESLFNDGVTVVLYNTFIALLDMKIIGAMEIVMAHLSFLFVVLGGALIGLFNGLSASYVTTFTQHVRVAEPLVLYSFAYMSFLVAELFHWSCIIIITITIIIIIAIIIIVIIIIIIIPIVLITNDFLLILILRLHRSGIISIIAYGITVKRYGLQNISKKSYTTVKYSIKTLASTSDCIIFLFLGLELVQENHHFHTGFIFATIVLCLVVRFVHIVMNVIINLLQLVRFISTFLFAYLVNIKRKERIDPKSQFIMAYGGLRGAVGFSLAVVLKEDLWYRELFVTTALAMVFFTVFLQVIRIMAVMMMIRTMMMIMMMVFSTVFVQGSTIKLWVKLFHIKLQEKTVPRICNDVQSKLMEDIMEGVGAVVGRQKARNCWHDCFVLLDKGLKTHLISRGRQANTYRDKRGTLEMLY